MFNGVKVSGKAETTPTQNKIRVLKVIRDGSEITRADIISKTGLSAPTVTRIVDSLISQKMIVQEESGASSGGRPPQIIRFDSKNNYVIGIDIGGTYIRAAFSNLDGEFLYEIHLPMESSIGFEGIMEQVGELIQKLLNRANYKQNRVYGIGIAVCGIVNRETERVDYSPVLNWKYVDIKQALKEYTELPISIGNVANLIAQGELYYGIGKMYNDFISLNLEYGIGSGIIINRQPFFGSQGYSGEIGHTIIDPRSTRKGRENISGTLEAFASSYAITDLAKERIELGEESSLSSKIESISINSVLKAAINGDKLATNIIETAADYIGISIDSLVKIFDPQAIILSGGLTENEEYFVNRIRTKVHSNSLPIYDRNIPILTSSFGADASLMGAFSLILQNVLSLD